MATIEIKVPSVGESVTEALLTQWFKQEADSVRKDEALFELETDKVTLEVTAEAAGRLHIAVPAGTTVKVGAVVGAIDPTSAAAAAEVDAPAAESKKNHRAPEPKPPVVEKPPPAPSKTAPPAPKTSPATVETRGTPENLPPSVRRLVGEHRLDVSQIQGTGPGGRLTKGDVLLHIEQARATPAAAAAAPAAQPAEGVCPPCEGPAEEITRKPMSPIRKRIAERLLEAQQNAAMLTTFNEVDMTAVIELRAALQGVLSEEVRRQARLHVLLRQGECRGA